MIQLISLAALATILVTAKQHRVPVIIAAAAVMMLMGGPQEFINSVTGLINLK